MSKHSDRFGYRAVHYDFLLGTPRRTLDEYRRFSGIPVELQIRTIFQDAWSVIDHQLKYKHKLHGSLSRRINVFAALCELVDQEFIRIRDDIRAAPTEISAPASGVEEQLGILDLRSFLSVLRDNFPADVVLPDQADILLATIRRLDSAITADKLIAYFGTWAETLQDGYDAFRAQRRRSLSPLTRTRLVLCVADSKTYDSLITSSDMQDLAAQLRRLRLEKDKPSA